MESRVNKKLLLLFLFDKLSVSNFFGFCSHDCGALTSLLFEVHNPSIKNDHCYFQQVQKVQKALPKALSPFLFKCRLDLFSIDLTMYSLSMYAILCLTHKLCNKLLYTLILLGLTLLSCLFIIPDTATSLALVFTYIIKASILLMTLSGLVHTRSFVPTWMMILPLLLSSFTWSSNFAAICAIHTVEQLLSTVFFSLQLL